MKNEILLNEKGEIRADNYQCVGPGSRHPNGNQYEVITDIPMRHITDMGLRSILEPYLRKEEDDSNDANDTNNADTSPSGKEFAEVCRLIKNKKSKEEIWEQMKAFKRWMEKPESYKERTYKAALEKTKEKKKKKDNLTSKYINEEEGIFAEQVYDKKNGSRFCIYNIGTGEITYEKSIKDGKFKPQTGEEIEKGAIVLPSKAEEYNSDEELDLEIITFARKWLDAPENVLQFGLWNTKRSWVFERFHTINYLRTLGDIGTGKTRYLDTWGYIHYKPIFTTGATTPAPLFRIIDKWRGTLVMDEADFRSSDESDQIIKIINQGFEKNRFIMRCDQNDAKIIHFFDPYCPKILATRKSFEDKATESRCITHVSSVTENKEIPLNLNEKFFEEAERIRNKLLMWRFKNYFKINKTLTYDLGDLEPRVKQIVSSYIYLFSNNKEQMENFKKYIEQYQEELIEERQSSFNGEILGAIHNLLERKITEISAGDIVNEGGFTNKENKALNPRALSSPLKSLGFKRAETKRMSGGGIKETKRCIPMEAKFLIKLFKRYGYSYDCVEESWM